MLKFEAVLKKEAHLIIPFDVPEGTATVSLEGRTTPHGLIYAYLYDANEQLRGSLLLAKPAKRITVHENGHSLGTVSGPVPAGTWTLHIHDFVGENVSQMPADMGYSVEILFDEPVPAQTLSTTPSFGSDHSISFDYDRCLKAEPGWYRGDLHAHTLLSDGSCSLPLAVDISRDHHLDFLFLTDHNLFHPDLPVTDHTLFLPGVEVTTDRGHCNVFCPEKGFSMNEAGCTCQGLVDAALAMNAPLSVNHPTMFPWIWNHEDLPLERIMSLEICCDPTWKTSPEATEEALKLFSTLWNHGVHITGVGGSDAHLLPEEHYDGATEPEIYGDPATIVHARELSANAILEGVAKGNVYVERRCGLSFAINGGNTLPGEQLSSPQVSVKLHVEDTANTYYAECVADGEVVAGAPVDPATGARFDIDLSGRRWMRVDIRRADGEFEGFINPVYLERINPTLKTWGDLLAAAQ